MNCVRFLGLILITALAIQCTVSLDRQGLVQEVRFDAISGRDLELPVASRRADCDFPAVEA